MVSGLPACSPVCSIGAIVSVISVETLLGLFHKRCQLVDALLLPGNLLFCVGEFAPCLRKLFLLLPDLAVLFQYLFGLVSI